MNKKNSNPIALVVADIRNENLGDKVIFLSLSRKLKREGFATVIKVANTYSESGFIKYINYRNIFKLLNSLFKADAVYVGGGGIFQDETSQSNLIYFALVSIIAAFFLKPIHLRGVGITILNTKFSELLVSLICGVSRSIEVRDNDSAMILAKYTNRLITVTADLALEYEPDFSCVPRELLKWEKENYLLISLRPLHNNAKKKTYFSEDVRQNFERKLLSDLFEIAQSLDLKLLFVPFHSSMDYTYLSGLLESYSSKNISLLKHISPDDFCFLAKHSKAVCTMRLHGAILASRYPVPIWAFEYDDKIMHFMKTIGLSKNTVKLKDIDKFGSAFLAKMQ